MTDTTPAPIANRYRLLGRIHAGSAGILYRAEDLALSREVVLRLLTPALSRDEGVLARLQARLAASAAMARDDVGASGDIVDVLDLGRAEGDLVFVVTEFIPGESLAAQLAREGPMRWPALRPLMVRACQILHLSHQHGQLRLELVVDPFFQHRPRQRRRALGPDCGARRRPFAQQLGHDPVAGLVQARDGFHQCQAGVAHGRSTC